MKMVKVKTHAGAEIFERPRGVVGKADTGKALFNGGAHKIFVGAACVHTAEGMGVKIVLHGGHPFCMNSV